MFDPRPFQDSKAAISVAVVIPSYKVTRRILEVIASIPAIVDKIYVVDDCCPEESGALVLAKCTDPRVIVIRHETNQGVGGAMVTGYRAAIQDKMEIVVKIDGDGQMDPSLVYHFIRPIALGFADYTKGNRFFSPETVQGMPISRVFGNVILSFLSKLSTGYWRSFDPTNGYTAIHRKLLQTLPLKKLVGRYFFESEMLFRLGTVGAAVVDIPMRARYADEESGLRIGEIIGEFAVRHLHNIGRRLFYNYILRDFSVATLELLFGFLFLVFGTLYGLGAAFHSAAKGIETPGGTIALAMISIILGIQLILSFLAFDIARTPQQALHPTLSNAVADTSNPLKQVRAEFAEISDETVVR
jgi:glycosyltransferase involved in cell wall biosynthesis